MQSNHVYVISQVCVPWMFGEKALYEDEAITAVFHVIVDAVVIDLRRRWDATQPELRLTLKASRQSEDLQ